MNVLTKSQKKVFDYITQYIQEKGYSPTFRDIQSHFGFSSLGSVYTYIKVLKRKGILTNSKRTSLSLNEKISTEKNQKLIPIPFIGYIAAGFPIEMFSQSQTLYVSQEQAPFPEQTYVLKARGETLIDEHILDGDFVLIEARNQASEGELIVASLENQEIMVKRYYPEDPYIRLEGSDGRHQSIIFSPEEITIQGVIVGIIRHY